MNTMMKKTALLTIVAFGILSRFLPHPPNMTAIGAMVLFSGFAIRPAWLAAVVPGVVILGSDLILGWHNVILFTTGAWVSLALLSYVGLQKFSWAKLGGMSVLASLWFFTISNFGVWWVGGTYAHSLSGLLECYTLAIPFLANQILGDLIFSLAIFQLYFRVFEPRGFRFRSFSDNLSA